MPYPDDYTPTDVPAPLPAKFSEQSPKALFAKVVAEICRRSREPHPPIVLYVSAAKYAYIQAAAADPTHPGHDFYVALARAALMAESIPAPTLESDEPVIVEAK